MRKVTNGKSKNGLGKLTLGPYPASKKVYLKGNIFPEIKVPMRKINLDKRLFQIKYIFTILQGFIQN